MTHVEFLLLGLFLEITIYKVYHSHKKGLQKLKDELQEMKGHAAHTIYEVKEESIRRMNGFLYICLLMMIFGLFIVIATALSFWGFF